MNTNVSAGIKVQVTQDTGTLAMSAANGTPSCESPLDVEEDVTNGDKVKIVGCTVGDATVQLLKGATELASYSITIPPPDTARLSPEPSHLHRGCRCNGVHLDNQCCGRCEGEDHPGYWHRNNVTSQRYARVRRQP